MLVLAGALAVAGACGYSTRGNLPDHIQTVAVPILKNRTQAPGLEASITAGIVNAFSTSGRLRVVPVEQADSILEGEIVSYSLGAISFDANVNATEYRLTVVLNVQFRDVRKNAVLWSATGLWQNSDFSVQGQVSETLSRADAGARVAGLEIGRRVAAAAVDRF